MACGRYPRQMGAAIGPVLSIARLGGMVLAWQTSRATIAFGYRAGLTVPARPAMAVGGTP